MVTMPSINDETLKKLDFLLQAVRQGKFDDTIKLVEFVDRLEGSPDLSRDITMLVNALDDLNDEVTTLRMDRDHLKSKVITLEGKVSTLEMEMTTVAKALHCLFSPNPLERFYDLNEIRNFLQTKGIYIG